MLDDLYKDFEYLLKRDLNMFEQRMIRKAYITGLAYGVKLVDDMEEKEVEGLLGEGELNGMWG